MTIMRISLGVVIVVMILLGLRPYATVLQAANAAKIEAPAPGDPDANTVGVRKRPGAHVTQEEREAAAARMAEQRKQMAARNGSRAKTMQKLASVPGGTPDYFGVANWAFSPPLRKFVDKLPGLGAANANNLGQYIPVAIPDTTRYPGSDYYEIEVGEYTERMHSDLPPTTLRGYRQTNTTDPTVREFHYLGPMILAKKNRPVRIKFTNTLPTGEAGDLFIPVDTTIMGAGMGPLGHNMPGRMMNYTQNRATIHLHGGKSPWISDGTAHQWITPAGEITPYPRGASVQNVPDMPDPGEGAQTYYYTNQQSSRLMFYHDHSLGITRLNVYVGEAAGYLITDEVEQELIASRVIPTEQIPLIIQDKSFVDAATVRQTDPTWNWGTGTLDPETGIREPKTGDLWYPHVYVPAQNPGDLAGMNAYGRWHYGPWFWPPTTGIEFPPVPNPYYDPVNAPWEPELAPGVPDVSMPGESFMDTAIVNGTAFPTLAVEPKAYRFRVLNAANDRFFNLQLYVADGAVSSSDGRLNTEVRMVPAEVNAAYPDWPADGREGGVPDPTRAGPSFVQIATEGGFLPKPAVIPNQPITWNLDPTTFNFGNVDKHALLLGPAERADVIIDFSQYAGKTLILYNDAPAAFPALDKRYDYYAGAPDLTDTGGHPGPEIGFGPNIRTVMQITVAAAPAGPAFNLTALEDAFASTAAKKGVFERAQDPILVPNAEHNSAYNKVFPTDTFVRIYNTSLKFTTLTGTSLTIPLQPKAIQDEMGEAFDPVYGRMSGKLGLELPGTNAGNQNFVLQAYSDPATENLTDCLTPMSPVLGDGTQIWKITHNGVDTHPIHFHLFDVQLINRVGWDGAIRPPDGNELGWKDTVRVSPLEDTIVALRPVAPKLPFGVPDSVRMLDPTMPEGSTMGFTNIDPYTGQPMNPPITNHLVNFGWEYMWHCHLLSHEEMDMMRPITFAVARALPAAPVVTASRVAGGVKLSWTDGTVVLFNDPRTFGNPANEIGFRVERASVDANGTVGDYAVIHTSLANTVVYQDTTAESALRYSYRIVAYNVAGDVSSTPVLVEAQSTLPAAPTNLQASLQSGAWIRLTWTDNANNENGFVIERAVNAGAFTAFASSGVTGGTGTAFFTDMTPVPGNTYRYRVTAVNAAGASNYSNTATVAVPNIPAAPSNLTGLATRAGTTDTVTLRWRDNANNETGFTMQRSTNMAFTAGLDTRTVAANATTVQQTSLPRGVFYYFRIRASNIAGASAWSNIVRVMAP